MTLRVAVAAPFAQRGTRELPENEFVVALSLDRKWFSPDQATRLIDLACEQGLLERADGALRLTFDPGTAIIPEDFEPDEDLLRERSPFEQVLEAAVGADIEKQTAVGAINAVQQDLAVTIDAAAVVYAHREGIDVQPVTSTARDRILEG